MTDEAELQKVLYDSRLFPLYLSDDNPGPLSEDNLLLSDYYIQLSRNSRFKIDLDIRLFNETLTEILNGDNELLKIRAILLIFSFKNVMEVTPTFEFLITEDLIRNGTEFRDDDNIFNDESRYFNDIFFTQLKNHPILILDFVEIIKSFVSRSSLRYDSLYPIINKIILSNEDSMTPVDPNRLIFMDESDVKEEYKRKINETYPIILPFNIKYEDYCKIVPKGRIVKIKVNREQILESIWLFNTLRDCDMRLSVSFLGETENATNDLTKEFTYLAFTNIMKKEADLFDYRNGYYWFKYHREMTEELRMKYRSVGMFLAVTILNRTTIPIRFPVYFYKKLLHRNIYITDLKIYDPVLFDGLSALLETTIDDFIQDEQDGFDFTYKDPLNEYEIDLTDFSYVEDPDNFCPFSINDANKKEYIEKVAEWVFNVSVKDAFEAFEEGYRKINSNEMLYKSFRLDEIDRIVSGDTTKDWEMLKQNAKYLNGYESDSQVIQWFWRYFDNLNETDKLEVLKFVTGTTSIPVGGLKEIEIIFYKGGTGCPRSHSCFTRIDLPEYSSFDELEDKCNEAFVITK